MTSVWLIRHGHTATSGHSYAGRTDVPLTAEGLRQAEDIARSLGGEPLDAILSSPLQRALQTAHPLADRSGCAITALPDLQEFDFGALEGRCKSEVAVSLRKAHVETPVPGGESLRALWVRTGRVARLAAAMPGGSRIAIVGHHWTNRMLYGHLAGLSLSEAARCRAYRPKTGSVLRLHV